VDSVGDSRFRNNLGGWAIGRARPKGGQLRHGCTVTPKKGPDQVLNGKGGRGELILNHLHAPTETENKLPKTSALGFVSLRTAMEEHRHLTRENIGKKRNKTLYRSEKEIHYIGLKGNGRRGGSRHASAGIERKIKAGQL